MPPTTPCTPCCTTPQSVDIPGPEGSNAFTFTTADFIVPPLGNQVTVSVQDSTWMAVGQTVFIEGAGQFTVIAKPTDQSVTLEYQNITANTASGNTISSGAEVSASAVATDGDDGQNAFTTTTADFTVPAIGDTVAIAVANSQWAAIGQNVFVEGAGYFEVTAKSDSTHMTIEYLDVGGNTNAGNNIVSGAEVSPAGPQLSVPGYQLLKVTNVFQGTVTYTPTTGCRALYVECIGAGGSGGGGGSNAANASSGSGGGGGAYSAVFLTTVKASYTVQVGAGGAAPSAGANAGNAGTDTTFDNPSVCTAKGGGAGGAGPTPGTSVIYVAGGAGGASGSGVGDIKLGGNDGGVSVRASGTVGYSGAGAGGPLGGRRAEVIAQGDGVAGALYGSGGSGGNTLNGGSATAGGAGANGLIRVWELV